MAVSKNMIAAAGEYLVCAELCRRNVLALVTPKNNPLFDVLASTPDGDHSVAIQVKTMSVGNKQGWKFGPDVAEELDQDRTFVVLVNMKADSNDFYIFQRNELARRVSGLFRDYMATKKRDGSERKDPGFRWFDLRYFTEDDHARLNRWELLGLPITALG